MTMVKNAVSTKNLMMLKGLADKKGTSVAKYVAEHIRTHQPNNPFSNHLATRRNNLVRYKELKNASRAVKEDNRFESIQRRVESHDAGLRNASTRESFVHNVFAPATPRTGMQDIADKYVRHSVRSNSGVTLHRRKITGHIGNDRFSTVKNTDNTAKRTLAVKMRTDPEAFANKKLSPQISNNLNKVERIAIGPERKAERLAKKLQLKAYAPDKHVHPEKEVNVKHVLSNSKFDTGIKRSITPEGRLLSKPKGKLIYKGTQIYSIQDMKGGKNLFGSAHHEVAMGYAAEPVMEMSGKAISAGRDNLAFTGRSKAAKIGRLSPTSAYLPTSKESWSKMHPSSQGAVFVFDADKLPAKSPWSVHAGKENLPHVQPVTEANKKQLHKIDWNARDISHRRIGKRAWGNSPAYETIFHAPKLEGLVGVHKITPAGTLDKMKKINPQILSDIKQGYNQRRSIMRNTKLEKRAVATSTLPDKYYIPVAAMEGALSGALLGTMDTKWSELLGHTPTAPGRHILKSSLIGAGILGGAATIGSLYRHLKNDKSRKDIS